MKIDVSHGELVDKLSILEIKLLKIDDNAKLENIKRELEALNPHYVNLFDFYGDVIKDLYLKLSRVNYRLWEIEDEIRILERERRFDKDFILLARLVYRVNDLRARIKREINELTDSTFVEEKSYEAT